MKPAAGILLFTLLFFSLHSCKQPNELPEWEILNRGLRQSLYATDMQNTQIYRAMESRLHEPGYEESAQVWQPKAIFYKQIADDAYNYIETLKKELKDAAGYRMENDQEVFNKTATSPVTFLFLTRGKGKKLYARLASFRNDMMKVDTVANPEIAGMLNEFDPVNNLDTMSTYFRGQPVISALTLLTNYQNKIRVTQQLAALYCLNRLRSIHEGCGYMSQPKLLINQSSNCVKPGETISIKAGVATFYWQANLALSISNKTIPVTDYGMIMHDIKAPMQPGKYSVPVKASYYEINGTQSTISSVIRYEVAGESQ